MSLQDQFDDEEMDAQAPGQEGSSVVGEKTSDATQAWLQSQLDKYSTGIGNLQKSRDAIFKEATQALLERQKQLEEPDWFGIAAALGRPTRTGSIGEELANVNEVLSAQSKERRATRQQLQDMQLKYKMQNISDAEARLEKELVFGIQLAKALPKQKQV